MIRDVSSQQKSKPRASWKVLRRWLQFVEVCRREEGSATAEYAIATMAAVGFAGLLVVILRGDEMRGILTELMRHALSFSG